MKYLLNLLAMILIAGCSSEKPLETYPVSGTITYQGKPLQEGRIAFIPLGDSPGMGPPIALPVKNGEFAGSCTAGTKKVEFYGSWPTGKMLPMDDGSGEYPEQESIPDQYNDKSNKQITLNAAPNQGLKFDLQ